MNKLQRITDFEELTAMKDEWNQLLANSHTNTVFLTHEWVTLWWRHFGTDKQLRLLLVRDKGELIGIAPLMLSNGLIQFIGAPLSDYSDFIYRDESALRTIYNHLLADNWKSISLEEIPEQSPTISLSRRILSEETRHFDIAFTNRCLSLNLAGDIKKILKKRDIQRNIKALEQNGEVIFHSADTLEAQELLQHLFEQHRKIWKERGIPSMFEEDAYRNFFIDLTKKLMPTGIVRVIVIKHREKPISIRFGFSYNNTFMDYCQSHDLGYSKFGPANILNSYIIDDCFQRGFKAVDFSRGGESYKERFSNTTSNNYGITIHRNAVQHMFIKLYNRMKERIMQNERLHTQLSRYKHANMSQIRKLLMR